MKKGSIAILLIFSFLIGSLFPTSVAQAGETITSLKKQIKSLQATINSQKQKLDSKDKEISNLKKQIAAKDKEITNLKTNIANPLKTKLAYEGNVVSGNYQIGKTSVPVTIDYKGVRYSPTQLLGELLESKAIYQSKEDTIFYGTLPNGSYMSDILEPFYIARNGKAEINNEMTMAGQKYNKGFSFTTYRYDKISFNLNGKYSRLTGIIGLEDYGRNVNKTYLIYGDGKLLGTYDIKASGLPLPIDLDVSGVKEFIIQSDDNKTPDIGTQLNMANLVIK